MAVTEVSSQRLGTQADLVRRLEAELQTYRETGLLAGATDGLIPKWQGLLQSEPQRFIDNQLSINLDSLQNFRRLQIFVPDSPGWDRSIVKRALRRTVTGGGRGLQVMMRQCLEVLQEHGYQDFLRKYPCHPAGNPYVFKHQGYSYTYRWVKHIYFLGLLNRVLGADLDEQMVSMDIGSSYGIFPSLLKQEYPKSHHILVDFPEQLVMAYYFLASCFPEARIAGVSQVAGLETVDRNFVEAHDFTLVPIPMYDRIAPGSADLVTNFASFGEMSRQWFEYYTTSPPFKTSKYLLTANRMQSYPTYDTDLTVVDYPVWDADKRMHFAVSPPFSDIYYYMRKRLFFNQRFAYPPYFEYVGRV